MSVVAVAGGLGDVGRTIVEEILHSKKHTVYILTLKPKVGEASKEYPSHLRTPVELGASESQLNLIRGVAASGVVTRFIPSEFNIDYHAPPQFMPYGPRAEFLRSEEELKCHPNLTYSLIRCGFFMDYLGLPYAVTNLHPLYCLIDLQASSSVIPGDGSNYVVLTHTRDVSKFVGALLGLQATKWPREATISGERITLNEVVQMAEVVTGKKFDKHHESLEQLRTNIVHELPSNVLCYSYFPGGKDELNSVICPQMVGMVSGVFDIQGTESTKIFPEIKTIRLTNFLQECRRKAEERALL